MGQRIRIGLTFSYNEGWIGGTYYFLNLIHALNTLKEEEKPHLTILSQQLADFNLVRKINYPYISFHKIDIQKQSILTRGINKIFRIFFQKELIKITPFKAKPNEQLDILFRGSLGAYFRTISNHLFWIPDFQEDYLPQFFKPEEIEIRKQDQTRFATHNNDIVFSSQDAYNDFVRLYPYAKGRMFVLNFAVSHPEYEHIDIKMLRNKYAIEGEYFFSPNQFWKHKNHQLVLEALKLLKEAGQLNFIIAFSGKESDPRNPGYFESLKTFVSENGLSRHIRFLGFIDRREQLQLMNNARAVIQPSLFEGWSTVVEDAKAMNQNIICSDLSVHKEQLEDDGYYFDRKDCKALADMLLYFSQNNLERKNFQYKERVNKFGKAFMEAVKQIVN